MFTLTKLCKKTISFTKSKYKQDHFFPVVLTFQLTCNIIFPGEPLSNATTLSELGVPADTAITLVLHQTGDTETSTSSSFPRPNDPTPSLPAETSTSSSFPAPNDATPSLPSETSPLPPPIDATPPGSSLPQRKAGSDTFTTSVVVGRETREVLVKIQRSELKKSFLGGYRHRDSGLEYHHAAVQTLPRPRPPREVRCCRQCSGALW